MQPAVERQLIAVHISLQGQHKSSVSAPDTAQLTLPVYQGRVNGCLAWRCKAGTVDLVVGHAAHACYNLL